MKQQALNSYLCAKCKSPNLRLSRTKKHQNNQIEIHEGLLVCDDCGGSFPIINSMPRFVFHEDYTNTFGFQWDLHRKTQLDSFTGLSISRDRLFEVTGWPESMKGQTILEAGSGAGRFTEILLETGAEIFSFDYSSAVDVNFLNNGHFANLNLFQGDIYNIPLRKYSFDKVLCLGVIQHTPDPEKAFKSLSQYVCAGGKLVLDVYNKNLFSLLHWKYLLRPLTKRMNKDCLYKYIKSVVPILLPISIFLRRVAGRVGARLLPITEYSYLGLPCELNRQWAILDTFDMYSPAHDYPQRLPTVKRWFKEAGFIEISVKYGPNGVIGKGRRP